MSDTQRNPDNYCYRHPDRESYIVCQRCGRTICTECQTPAAVGVHCPECVREARQSAPRRAPRVARSLRNPGNRPVVTYALIALNVLVYIVQFATGSAVTQKLTYYPVLTLVEPWTMVTALFVHGGILHIALNMYSLFVIGPMLEYLIGRWRYLIAGFGGSVAVLLLAPQGGVLGASGAIFGLLGALFVVQRHLGQGSTQLLVLIVINLAAGFVLPGVSWQAHVGGLVVGAGIGLLYLRTRNRRQRGIQVGALGAIVVALVGITGAGLSLL